MFLPRAAATAGLILALGVCSGCAMREQLAAQPPSPPRTALTVPPVTGAVDSAAVTAYVRRERAAELRMFTEDSADDPTDVEWDPDNMTARSRHRGARLFSGGRQHLIEFADTLSRLAPPMVFARSNDDLIVAARRSAAVWAAMADVLDTPDRSAIDNASMEVENANTQTDTADRRFQLTVQAVFAYMGKPVPGWALD
jgi:hypothetical protein